MSVAVAPPTPPVAPTVVLRPVNDPVPDVHPVVTFAPPKAPPPAGWLDLNEARRPEMTPSGDKPPSLLRCGRRRTG